MKNGLVLHITVEESTSIYNVLKATALFRMDVKPCESTLPNGFKIKWKSVIKLFLLQSYLFFIFWFKSHTDVLQEDILMELPNMFLFYIVRFHVHV